MANTNLTSLFTDIADAIRYAENSDGAIHTSDFAARIRLLSGGVIAKFTKGFRDTTIIPDKYSVGYRCSEEEFSELTTSGGTFGDIYFKAISGGKIPLDVGYANRRDGLFVCEKLNAGTNNINVINATAYTAGVRTFKFVDCKFNGWYSSSDFSNDLTHFVFENCSFSWTVQARNAEFTNCSFTVDGGDCLNGFHDVTLKNCYMRNTTGTTATNVHIDGIQFSAGNASNNLIENCRFETIQYANTGSGTGANAGIMYQIESTDSSDNIVVKDCILNGGGYSIYTWNKSGGTVTNFRLHNILVGQSHLYGNRYPRTDGVTFLEEDINDNTTLYVSSVIKDDDNIHIITSNDLLVDKTLTVVTNLGTTTFDISKNNRRDDTTATTIDDLPIDIDNTISSSGVEYVVCYDGDTQIRFVDFTDDARHTEDSE